MGLAWAIRQCICHVAGYAFPRGQFAADFQDGIGDRTDVRVDAPKIAQDVEMQRASLYAFRAVELDGIRLVRRCALFASRICVASFGNS
jgi:hypothetical protein